MAKQKTDKPSGATPAAPVKHGEMLPEDLALIKSVMGDVEVVAEVVDTRLIAAADLDTGVIVRIEGEEELTLKGRPAPMLRVHDVKTNGPAYLAKGAQLGRMMTENKIAVGDTVMIRRTGQIDTGEGRRVNLLRVVKLAV